MENEKKQREEIVSKWETLGFLDGLKGHLKEDIARLYEGCRRIVINEETGKTECCKEGVNCDDRILPVAKRLINDLPPDQEIVTVIKKEE
jgi:hypothetical protein